MKHSFGTYGCLWILILVLFYSTAVYSQEDAKYNLDFVNTDLELFIQFVAKTTNMRILYDATIKGKKIHLVSSDPVTKDELYALFLSVMEYNGYILETTGKKSLLVKVKRNIQGPWTSTITIFSEEELEKIQHQDQFITMVIRLKNIAAREVQTTLRALRIVNPQGGNLAGIEGSNTILITDFAPNVKRIYEVIKLMDQEGPQQAFKIIKLKHAIAEEVVAQLKEIVQNDKRRGGSFKAGPNMGDIKLIADKRLNAVVVEAYASRMKHITQLIHELDQSLDTEPGNIHYIGLKHADASKLQEVLGKLVESGGLPVAKTRGKNPSQTEKNGVSIQAEPQTNSLIIRADSHQWQEIKQIIEQVDVRRPQVLLEAALIEISPTDALELGFEVFGAERPKNNHPTFSGGTDFGMSNLVLVNRNDEVVPLTPEGIDDFDRLDSAKVGRLPNPNTGGLGYVNYEKFYNIPLIMNVLKSESDIKVFSLPRIVTNDHEKAEISVTEEEPTTTTSESSSGSIVTSFQGYEEAGTTLTITPHISGEQNYLRLEIEQSIDEFNQSTSSISSGSVPPSKRNRKITTSVTVPDGHTVTIGGLTFDSQEDTVQKFPVLGDLPLIGMFFQSRVITHRKRNIYLFVTPHILREDSFKDLFQKSYENKEELEKFGFDVGVLDKSFTKYKDKYDVKDGELAPMYMLEYQTPTQQNSAGEVR